MNDSTERLMITIPITQTDRCTAQGFAQQLTLEKSKQVYLNTLAVLVVQNYLQMLDIPTQLESSYSWNSVGRMCADVADLSIGWGRLECRPIVANEPTCFVPPEVWEDRIGYIVVKVDETCRQGTLLGFVPTVSQQMLPIEQLQPLENLLMYLHQPTLTAVRLSQWFNNIIEPGWQTVESLLGSRSRQPVLAFRTRELRSIKHPENLRQLIEQLYASQSETSAAINIPPDLSTALIQLLQITQDEEIRWTAAEILWTTAPGNPASGVRRVLDLGMQLAGHAVALMVAILPKPDQKIAVLLRVYPMGQPHLPPGLQLVGLDEAGNPFLAAQSRRKDDYTQLKFSADPGERFSVRVVLDDASITENFAV